MAHTYTATVAWARDGEDFLDRRYSRGHVWRFDGGVEVPASSSPLVVRVPLSRLDAVDPEEALTAAASSCHMLYFLDFACRAGFRVDSYADAAECVVDKRPDGKMAVTKVVLKPAITFSGDKRPSEADLADLHHQAHEHCIIANSITAEMVIEPPPPVFA